MSDIEENFRKIRLLKRSLCFRLQMLFPLRYFQFHVLVPLDKELERNKAINAIDRLSCSEGSDSIVYNMDAK